jgi:hypothetical protein
MSRIRRGHNSPVRGLEVSLISSVSIVFLLLAPVSSCGIPAQVEAAAASTPASGSGTRVVSYTLDDFDDPLGAQPRTPNDFFGRQGRWEANGAVITDSLVCQTTFSCYLSLAYVLTVADAAGGYWEEFTHSYSDPTWPLYDLREFDQLRFRVKGDHDAGFPEQFQIEFVGQDWSTKTSYTITGVTDAWQWVTVTLTHTGTFDWSRVKQVALVLDGKQLADKQGRLYLDDLTLVDTDFAGDLLELISQRAFRYFWDNRHPTTGFVRDRAIDPFYTRDVTSVATVGFELAAFGIGAEHGWISRTEAALATRQVLNSLLAPPQGPEATGTSGYQGFFYHLLAIDTGLRVPDSEVSTIDTALMLAGVLFARQYYAGTDPTETDIRDLAGQLYNRVAWDWALRIDPQPSDKTNQFHMAWKPERHDCSYSGYQNCYEIPDTVSGHGFFSGEWIADTVPPTVHPTTWDYYTDEILLINLLAIGSPTHSVPADTFTAWTRATGKYDDYTLYQSWSGQLFTYFIGQVWVNLRGLEERDSHINWWRNSELAALAQRQFAIDHASTCKTYSAQSWGFSAGLGPPSDPTSPGMDGIGVYRGYGALPKGDPSPPLHDCTVTPYAAAGSIIFLSADPTANEAYQALAHWSETQPRLWGLYGFRDGFNIDQDWYAHDYIGLDQGMTLLALENYRTGLIWATLGHEPALVRAIAAVLTHRNYLPVVRR